MSTTSSRPPMPDGKPPAALLSPRERTLQAGGLAQAVLPPVIEAERRVRRPLIVRETRTPKPDVADDVLAAVARHFEPGTRLGVRQIAEATGFSMGQVIMVRQWAKAAGHWAYSSGRREVRNDPGRPLHAQAPRCQGVLRQDPPMVLEDRPGRSTALHELWFQMGFKPDKWRIPDWKLAEMCGRSLRWVQKALRQLLDAVDADGEPCPLIGRYRIYGRRDEAGRVIEIIIDFAEAKKGPGPKPTPRTSRPAAIVADAAASDPVEPVEPSAEERRQAAEQLKELLAKARAEQAANKAGGRKPGPSLAAAVTVSPELERERNVAELARIEAIPADQRSSLQEQIRIRLSTKLSTSHPARE